MSQDVLERLRAANPVPSEQPYPPDETDERIAAAVHVRRAPRHTAALTAAAGVVVIAGLVLGAAALDGTSQSEPGGRPSDTSVSGGDGAPFGVTVQCRAGTGELTGAQFDRAGDVVADRLRTLGLDRVSTTDPTTGFIDFNVADDAENTATKACHSTSVAVRLAGDRTSIIGASGIVNAVAVEPSGGRVEWAVRVTFTPVAVAQLTVARMHAAAEGQLRHRPARPLELLVDGKVVLAILPSPDNNRRVTITGGFNEAAAEKLADDIAGAAFGLHPQP